MDVASQRETSSSLSTKLCSSNRLKQKVKPPAPPPAAAARKVQVVYYLSRNGLLEHPHFMELTLFPNQPLRLTDVFDRLKALRGSDMPLQYSWSSKRNYKSGYVWHDLAVKDIIHPAGGEYVLKGSELVQGCSERFQLLNVMSNKQAAVIHHQMTEPNCIDDYNHHSKHKQNKAFNNSAPQEHRGEEYEYEERDEKRSSNTNTSSSRCSRGVSTEEEDESSKINRRKVVMINTSSSTDDDLGEKVGGGNNNRESRGRRSRHWVLLQLISCGSSALAELNNNKEGSKEDLRRRGLQYCEEKEYFSGSIVDSMKALEAEPPPPLLNRSNSYNEQRHRDGEGEAASSNRRTRQEH